MKLIDILVMISKGELKEGTTFRDKETGMKISEFVLGKKELGANRLNEEYEIIEPDHFTDDGKMAEKIKELDNYDWPEDDYNYQIEMLYRKLNEVIRRINNVR
jgi:hypothetical protein